MVFVWLLFTIFIITLVWLRRNYSYWQRLGVPGPKPLFFIGNIGSQLTLRNHWGVQTTDWYNEYPNEPYIGFYKFNKPAILLRDANLIKRVLIENFDSFSENEFAINENCDPILANIPFTSADDVWKIARKEFLPVFNTNHTKNIVPIMNQVGEQLIKFIKAHPINTEFDAKNLMLRFTTENLFKSTFSVEPHCLDIEQESNYLELSHGMFKSHWCNALKWKFIYLLPKWIVVRLPLQIVPTKTDQFFRHVVESSILARLQGYQQNDILQLCLQMRERFNFPDMNIVGQLFTFFWDSTDTSSSAMYFALYELALNQRCQDILYDEIDEILKTYDNEFTHEALEDLIYLEAILYETMRMHSPILVYGKVCTKRFTLPRNEHQPKPFTILPGMSVTIPVNAIHLDAQHYPNPDQFQPERFYPEEQLRRQKATFLTFGVGPRICPAIAFSLIQMKVALVHIIKHFRIELTSNQRKIELDPKTLIASPKNGIFIKFVPR